MPSPSWPPKRRCPMKAPDWIAKVGGSLLAVPGIGQRLQHWLEGHGSSSGCLVPGGGLLADFIRRLDQGNRLGDETAHWLAVRAMSFNADVLASLVPRGRVIQSLAEAEQAWHEDRYPIVDPELFLRCDERRADPLPHSWSVTSDSIAGRIARRWRARELILFKSCPVPAELSWEERAARGFVDQWFPIELVRCGKMLVVRWVDLLGEP